MTEDGVKEYVEFGKRVQTFAKNVLTGKAETLHGTSTEHFSQRIQRIYSKSHLYKIDENTKKLLMLTNAPKENGQIKLPFPEMFIGCHFTKEEIEKYTGIKIEYDDIFGLLLQEGGESAVFDKITGKSTLMELNNSIKIIACCEEKLSDGRFDVVFNTMHVNVVFDEDLDYDAIANISSKDAEKTKKFSKIFMMNVLNLIHNPEVEFVTSNRDDNQNKKRINRGQLPLPGQSVIRLTGKLKIYVDSLSDGESFTYNHKFYVRGFWRQLKSDRYVNALKENKYGRGFGVVWVLPSIKGQGLLIEKDYEVNVQ